MGSTKARRRRFALLVLAVLGAGSFLLGALIGAGPGGAASPVSGLTPAQLAGERIVTGLPGTTVSPPLRAAIRGGRVAGVVLFSANFPTAAAGQRLIAALQRIPRPPALRAPLLIMVDQEGGEVKRVPGPPAASAAKMGARGAAYSRRQGVLTGESLRRLGVNVDLAPVLDVARPGGVIANTERGFGSTAPAVSATAVPFAEGLRSGGVAATGKHFPGLGAARESTDFSTERINLSKRELRRVDEAPYRPYIAAGGELVMVATAIYPAFSPVPAAFSPAIATGELRERLGFEGVSITDSLETAAVRAYGGAARAGVAAARAGDDLLLFTRLGPAEAAARALVAKLGSGALDRAQFEASAARVLALRSRLAP